MKVAAGRAAGRSHQADDLAALDGQFDHIADTTGVPALLGLAVDRLAQRGTLALVGAYPPGGFTIDPSSIMSMGRRIVGVVEGGIDPQLFIPRLITYYREGRLPLEKLIKRYAFADLEAAFAASESGAVIKPVVLMPQD